MLEITEHRRQELLKITNGIEISDEVKNGHHPHFRFCQICSKKLFADHKVKSHRECRKKYA